MTSALTPAAMLARGRSGARDGVAARRLFWAGVLALVLFELAAIWFIMPLPGSQRIRSVRAAYFLHTYRWLFRGVALALLLAGVRAAWLVPGRRRWLAPAGVALAAAAAYMANVQMSADHIFRQPTSLVLRPARGNAVDRQRLVVGIEIDGAARAYPLQFIGYHHQVRDTVNGRPVLVSYCTVCRTGRVFDPTVDGRVETFRLVGMDQFNAMFEDRTTGSWWRQANGEAIVGPRAGTALREIPSRQMTLGVWLALHPHSLVMQADPAFVDRYAKGFDYENGKSRKALTGTDTASWRDKSWVVGITVGRDAKAFDWNRLKRERAINDEVGGKPIVLVLAADTASFFAFERPDAATRFAVRGDSVVTVGAPERGVPERAYALTGRGAAGVLAPVPASQEFWHSWRTFHPGTRRY